MYIHIRFAEYLKCGQHKSRGMTIPHSHVRDVYYCDLYARSVAWLLRQFRGVSSTYRAGTHYRMCAFSVSKNGVGLVIGGITPERHTRESVIKSFHDALYPQRLYTVYYNGFDCHLSNDLYIELLSVCRCKSFSI